MNWTSFINLYLMSTIKSYIFWPIQRGRAGSSSTKLKREKAGIQYIGSPGGSMDLPTHTSLSSIGRGFDLALLTCGPWNWGQGQISWSHVYIRNSLSLEANTTHIWNPWLLTLTLRSYPKVTAIQWGSRCHMSSMEDSHLNFHKYIYWDIILISIT